MGTLAHIVLDQTTARTRGWRFVSGGEPSAYPVRAETREVARRLPPSTPRATVAVSVVLHGAVLLLATLLVQSRVNEAATEPAGVQMVFEPAQAAAPSEAHLAAAVPPDRDAAAPVTPPAAAPPEAAPPEAAPPPPVQQPPPLAAVPPPPEVPVSPSPPPPPVVAAVPAPPDLPVPPVPPPEAPTAMQQRPIAPARPVARPRPAQATEAPSAAQPAAPAQAETRLAVAGSAGFAADAPIIPPRPVAGMDTNRAPPYPELARQRGNQGRVLLRVNVSADGTPLDVAVMQTSGFHSLDEAALAAIRQWRFVPAMQAGHPVPAAAEVPVRFRLDD